MRIHIYRHCLITTSLLLSLSGCFAMRLELDDPMGLPLLSPQVAVQIQSESVPELALQLQNELIQLLPRERQVQTQPSDSAPAEWRLQAQLSQRRQQLDGSPPLLSGQAPDSRIHIELTLEASLTPANGPAQQWKLVRRGN
ncbi:MAG: hypothetical protein CVV27_06045, partial [Candidatus Melainabacteria bacterium HGW-Melainabacteria-1]